MKKVILVLIPIMFLIGCTKKQVPGPEAKKDLYIKQEVILRQNQGNQEFYRLSNGEISMRVVKDTAYKPNTYYIKTVIVRPYDRESLFWGGNEIYTNQTGYLPADSVLYYKKIECDKAKVILDNLNKFNSEGGCN